MMLTYDLKVGYACNNRCKHCVIDDSKDKLIEKKSGINLTTEECFAQIDKAIESGAKGIVLTGGEVTLRKDFNLLVKRSSDLGLDITIQTNGRKLFSPMVLDAVKDIKDIRFVVALHGSTAQVHDDITQVKGSFDETCYGIKKMCELGKLVVLKIVISKINATELPNIVKLASSLGVQYFCFAFPHGQGAARKNFEEVIPTYSYLKPILDELISTSKLLNVNIEFEAIPFCIIPNDMKLVGELKYFKGDTLCEPVKEEAFRWSKVRRSIKKKGKNCVKCDMNEFCEGPWSEYVEAFGDIELQPISFPEKYRDRILINIKNYLKVKGLDISIRE